VYKAAMRALAFSVHILTACGAALGLLALLAAVRGEWPLMFLWLGLALVVDAIDGMLARALSVAERVPRWSGDTIDLVVDFTTYVFVPAYAVAVGLMPGAFGVASGALIVITGAIYFADRRMKDDNNYFCGFPALWNLIAFYLLLLRPAPWVVAAMVVVFAVLTFVPVRFVHPFRVRALRPVTVTLLAVWSALALAAVLHDLAPALWITASLCIIALYFLGVGLLPRRQPQ
jgi:phosphatidylcholine synthase